MGKIYKYTVPLAPVTKKNSPQIFYMGARCPVCHKGKTARVMPSAAYLKYERAAMYYLTPKPKKADRHALPRCDTVLHADAQTMRFAESYRVDTRHSGQGKYTGRR